MSKIKSRLISCAILVVLLGAGVLLFWSISGGAASVGMSDGVIAFSETGTDITAQIGERYKALEDDFAELYVLPDGNIELVDKESGAVCAAVADSAGRGVFSNDDADLGSAVIIEYLADGMTETRMYSSTAAVEKGQFRVYLDGDRLGVEYILGEKSDTEFLPEIFTVERFEEDILPALSESDAEYLGRRYKKYYAASDDPELIPDDEVLSGYPMLRNDAYYILVSADGTMMRTKTMELLQKAGYTYGDMQRDYEEIGFAVVSNPLTFKVTLEYRLEKGDLLVTLPADGILFYQDNPLLSIQIMKYFTSSVGQDGFFVIPSGSGGVMRFGEGYARTEFAQRVYGVDDTVLQTTVPYEMGQNNTAFSFPMYGMQAGQRSVMAILESGAAAARFGAFRNGTAAYAGFTVDVVQSDYASIGSAEPMLYCGEEQLSEDVVIRYRTLREGTEEYADYAVAYRDYLLEQGLLPEEGAVSESVPVEIETVGIIYGNDGLLGLVPARQAKLLTSFAQSGEIVGFFSDQGIENLSLCLSGWNKEGLLAQQPGRLKYAGQLGGKSGLELLLAEPDIPVALTLNAAYYYGDTAFNGYSPGKMSSRYIDKSVASMEGYDVISGWTNPDRVKTEIVSPAQYRGYLEGYADRLLQGLGADFGRLGGVLNSDYSELHYIDRAAAQRAVCEALSVFRESGRRVVTDSANLYALPFVDLIDGLPLDADSNVAFSETVPFVQIVLHGYVEYTSPAANLGGSIQKTVLKSIEYGAGLHFVFTENLPENLYDTEFSYLYDTEFTKKGEEAYAACLTVQEALSGLNGIPITGHAQQNGLSRTVYADGTEIIVNHNSFDAAWDGIPVPAESYIRR